ncbi:MAG: bacterial transcriptional activator domain-containing protein [bacterium]|nr:bacterial transcriptional activator domain-containing protein [bacterium]
MFNHLQTLVRQQLQALDDRTRLIVVHPNYREQHQLLSEFLQSPALYLRVRGTNLSQEQLEQQLDEVLATQHPEQSAPATTLILDECDRVNRDALNPFLNDLLNRFAQSRIVLLGRDLPQALMEDTQLRHQMAFVPHDETTMLWDYARRSEPTHLLEVRAFGEGRVILHGQQIDNWDGVLPRALFFYLVDRGMTTRNEIFETFWPTLPVREATNVFHVTKRKISEVLGIDLTTYWSGFYRISPDIHLSYDVILFTDMVNNSAIMSLEEADRLLTRALALYRGHFLSPTDSEWAKKRRSELSQNYSEALAALAKVKEELAEDRQALGLYLRSAALSPNREDLTSSVMRLYRRLNMPEAALSAYDRFVEAAQSDPTLEPAPQLEQMALAIRNHVT